MIPIDRAAQAIRDYWQVGKKATKLDLINARTAFESIDTEELADALRDHHYEIAYGGCACGADFEDEPPLDAEHTAYNAHLALAVKNWLTGKNQ